MPASTSDPISSVLQRTFGGLEQKREGLIRGGNSSSASATSTAAVTNRPFSSVDKQIQASVKNGLVLNGSNMNSSSSIAFDAPTSFKSEMSLHPKVIVLNPKAASSSAGANGLVKKKEVNGAAATNGQKPKEEGIPQAKVRQSYFLSFKINLIFCIKRSSCTCRRTSKSGIRNKAV